MLDSYLRSCCSLAGMVLHLDLLNCGEAVDRLSNCLLPSVYPYIHFRQHGPAAVTVCSIPRLQPARVDECTLQAPISVTSAHHHSSCSLKHTSHFSRVFRGSERKKERRKKRPYWIFFFVSRGLHPIQNILDSREPET